jgi:hypothetical protein
MSIEEILRNKISIKVTGGNEYMDIMKKIDETEKLKISEKTYSFYLSNTAEKIFKNLKAVVIELIDDKDHPKYNQVVFDMVFFENDPDIKVIPFEVVKSLLEMDKEDFKLWRKFH